MKPAKYRFRVQKPLSFSENDETGHLTLPHKSRLNNRTPAPKARGGSLMKRTEDRFLPDLSSNTVLTESSPSKFSKNDSPGLREEEVPIEESQPPASPPQSSSAQSWVYPKALVLLVTLMTLARATLILVLVTKREVPESEQFSGLVMLAWFLLLIFMALARNPQFQVLQIIVVQAILALAFTTTAYVSETPEPCKALHLAVVLLTTGSLKASPRTSEPSIVREAADWCVAMATIVINIIIIQIEGPSTAEDDNLFPIFADYAFFGVSFNLVYLGCFLRYVQLGRENRELSALSDSALEHIKNDWEAITSIFNMLAEPSILFNVKDGQVEILLTNKSYDQAFPGKGKNLVLSPMCEFGKCLFAGVQNMLIQQMLCVLLSAHGTGQVSLEEILTTPIEFKIESRKYTGTFSSLNTSQFVLQLSKQSADSKRREGSISKTVDYLQRQQSLLEAILDSCQESRCLLKQPTPLSVELTSLTRTAQTLNFENESYLAAMKALKKEFRPRTTARPDPESIVAETIDLFAQVFSRRRINVQVLRANGEEGQSLRADWKIFQLSVFNIVGFLSQKCSFDEDVVVLLDFKNGVITSDFIFHRIGAAPQISLDEDSCQPQSLSCARTILQALGGDLEVPCQQSELLVVQCQMPAKKEKVFLNASSLTKHNIIFNHQRPLSSQTIKYLEFRVGKDAFDFSYKATSFIEPQTDQLSEDCQEEGRSGSSQLRVLPNLDDYINMARQQEGTDLSSSSPYDQQSAALQVGTPNFDKWQIEVDEAQPAVKRKRLSAFCNQQEIPSVSSVSSSSLQLPTKLNLEKKMDPRVQRIISFEAPLGLLASIQSMSSRLEESPIPREESSPSDVLPRTPAQLISAMLNIPAAPSSLDSPSNPNEEVMDVKLEETLSSQDIADAVDTFIDRQIALASVLEVPSKGGRSAGVPRINSNVFLSPNSLRRSTEQHHLENPISLHFHNEVPRRTAPVKPTYLDSLSDSEQDNENNILDLPMFQDHFKDTLPILDVPSPACQARIRNSIRSVKRRNTTQQECDCQPKILLVDDNEFNLMPLQILIKDLFQIQTEQACNGLVAVEKFEEAFNSSCSCDNRGFKFIFMDLQMPEMDGFQAAQRILEITEEANVADHCRIVALTSFTGADTTAQAMASGMKEVINKPLQAQELERVVIEHFLRTEG